jgi:hypothetical protein
MQVCRFFFEPVVIVGVSYSQGEKGKNSRGPDRQYFLILVIDGKYTDLPCIFRGGIQKKVLCGKQSTFLKYFIHEDPAS